VSGLSAPAKGWYPDPAGGVRLRWWDGTDWTESYRSRPGAGEFLAMARLDAIARAEDAGTAADEIATSGRDMGGLSRTDAEEIISQVRQVARSEVNRAADVFSARARTATSELEPLISQYTSRFFRWLKIVLIVIVVLAVAWFVFAAIANATFFEWLGDRIDNLTDD